MIGTRLMDFSLPAGNNGEIYTPLIGYAVLEGDTVNVSHLDIQYSTNSTVWPGKRMGCCSIYGECK